MIDAADVSNEELEQERDFLLTSLYDLEAEHDAGDVDDHDYQSLKDSYTARAAAVLRLLDERLVSASTSGPRVLLDPTPAAPSACERASGSGPAVRHGRRGTILIVAAVIVFAVVSGGLVMRSAGTRLPGDTVSGSTPTNPETKLLVQAQSQFQNQHLLDAIKTYDQVITMDPANAEALAYKGWLLRLAGAQGNDQALINAGLASIRKAEAAKPAYPDAHFFAGETLLRDKSDPSGAIAEFEQFLADNPPQAFVPLVQGELNAARAQLPATATTTTAG